MIIYLYDVESDYSLKDENLEITECLREFFELSDEEGSFLGIKTDQGIIQFAWEDEDKWLVDIPYDMKNFNSLQKYADYDECVDIIKTIFMGKDPQELDNLVKVNLKTETLDQIL